MLKCLEISSSVGGLLVLAAVFLLVAIPLLHDLVMDRLERKVMLLNGDKAACRRTDTVKLTKAQIGVEG